MTTRLPLHHLHRSRFSPLYMRPLPWLHIQQHFWARQGLLGPGPPAVLTSAALSFDLGSCRKSYHTSHETPDKHHPWQATDSVLYRDQVGKTAQTGCCRGTALWLGGCCSVVWLLLYRMVIAVTVTASGAYCSARLQASCGCVSCFQKVCVCVLRERDRERSMGFQSLQQSLVLRLCRPPLA